jgi:hypothetical protein
VPLKNSEYYKVRDRMRFKDLIIIKTIAAFSAPCPLTTAPLKRR